MIIALILFSLMFSMISVVFAATNVNIKDDTLTISDFDFKIPDGYSEDESQRKLDSRVESSSNFQDSTVIFKNNDKKINVTIRSSTDGGELTDSNVYGTNETIAGIAGSYLTDTSKITDNNVAFLYAKDGKGIYISAPDKQTIEQILE